MSLVSLVEIQGERFRKAIVDSLNLIHYNFPSDTKNIVIKPNLCYYWDSSTGYTTDPRFVGSMIDVLREKISPQANISIVESDASAMKCVHAFRMLGYEDLARRYEVNLVNLSKDRSRRVVTEVGDCRVTFRVPETIEQADLRINVTKIKYSMEKIKITCALKNIFGCIPYSLKFVYHPVLEEAIVAANRLMEFDLCVLDGNIVAGVPITSRRLRLVMASTDPVAFDTVVARIAGVNPKSIRYLRLADKEGIGNMKFKTTGLPWKYFGARYPKKGAKGKLMSKAFEMVHMLKLESRLMLD